MTVLKLNGEFDDQPHDGRRGPLGVKHRSSTIDIEILHILFLLAPAATSHPMEIPEDFEKEIHPKICGNFWGI